eukprot:14125393-Alexandrium_andersonii.AAC.1
MASDAEEGAGAHGSKRAKAADGASRVKTETASADAATAAEEPRLIKTPTGAAKLVDVGGTGECAWLAISYAMARAKC